METTKMGTTKADLWGAYTVRVWFNDEWLTEGGSHRIHLHEALAQAAHMRRYGDRVRIWHATEGYIDEATETVLARVVQRYTARASGAR